MGDLGGDTAIEQRGPTTWTANLRDDWAIWGPAGGYVAAVALRAAGAACDRRRPVSLVGHFLGVAGFDEVEIEVSTKRATRAATSVAVDVTQAGRPVFTALVWGADEIDGLEHHTARTAPAIAPVDELPTSAERRAAAGVDDPGFAFFRNLEMRPATWIDNWETRPPTEAEMHGWYRFVPTAAFDDPWLDACRPLILIDLDGWPAAVRPHPGELAVYAPTIDLSCRFHHLEPEPWLHSAARAPVAHDGLIGATGEVWYPDGRLAATGGSTLLCRPTGRMPGTGG